MYAAANLYEGVLDGVFGVRSVLQQTITEGKQSPVVALIEVRQRVPVSHADALKQEFVGFGLQ